MNQILIFLKLMSLLKNSNIESTQINVEPKNQTISVQKTIKNTQNNDVIESTQNDFIENTQINNVDDSTQNEIVENIETEIVQKNSIDKETAINIALKDYNQDNVFGVVVAENNECYVVSVMDENTKVLAFYDINIESGEIDNIE